MTKIIGVATNKATNTDAIVKTKVDLNDVWVNSIDLTDPDWCGSLWVLYL